MAASLQPAAMSSLILLLVIFSLSPAVTLSQDDPNPTVAQCATRLLPLAPCAAFVQGSTPSPSQSCCDNLKQLYTQQHHCLCMLLNNTTLSAFPINSSLALQLPQLCSLQLDISVCSPGVNGSTSPGSQVSFGSRDTNSTVNSTAAGMLT
ncbi:hypothetical protein TIFTF001_038653 [Ficus carica]|uniref:Bifunctional inhibitor/plant lipid transfer protein/seed storage helical domain-containing protein n=1 Tax=Ficus carica TaxID=3494 RepID=A0AA88J8Z7_FICCA|nr:hypothetical protein TIFTF001_037474 [Ficus carica]GMN69607.1 hypothetical protein TIFTF001_038653 [Ficus carica]